MAMISDNILRLQDHIARICQKLKRRPEEITIVGITKYSESEDILKAIACGINHIGESKVQQALKKYPSLTGVTKHMVGHLQRNKVKDAVLLFDVIQSVDSYRLAQEINDQCAKINRPIKIFVQVNTAGEAQKFGISPSEIDILLKQIGEFKNIEVVGLMAMAPLTDDTVIVRDCFKKLKDLYQDVSARFACAPNIHMKFLSMGMSDDYAIALEEGANMLRIGREIFLDR
jgi:pyridoxal phosphate enzyme (YggS family)